MEVVIYADVLFATNFLMDLVILFLTMQFSRMEFRLLRLTAAAVLLALYGTISFLPELHIFLSGIGRILAGGIALWILAPPGGIRGFWKAGGILSLVSVVMGGVVYALAAGTGLGQRLSSVMVNGSVYFLLDIRVLLVGIFVCYGLLLWYRQIFIRNYSRDKVLVPLTFVAGGKTVTVTALADTGCELTVPVTGAGVLLVSEYVCKGISPKDSFWLPVHTATGDDRVPAFYPEEISCPGCRYTLEETPAIGIVKGRFSRDGLYSGVFNPKILGEKSYMGGRYHEKETTTIVATIIKNLAEMVPDSPQGGLLHRRKRIAALAPWQRGRGVAPDATEPAGREGTSQKNPHRAESPAGGLHSQKV